MRKLETLYSYLFCLFCFFIPFEKHLRVVPNIILIGLGIIFPFVVNKSILKRLINDKRQQILLLLILFIVIQGVVMSTLKEDVSFLINIISVLYVTVVAFPLKNFENAKVSFVISVFVCVIISLVNVAFYAMNTTDFSFSNGAEINNILIVERIYLGLLSVLSVIFSIDLIKKYIQYKKLLTINVLFCVALIFLISARVAIITIIVVLLYRLIFLKNKKVRLRAILIGVAIIMVFFITNKNLQKRFLYVEKEHSFIENIKIWEPRVAIWNCAFLLTLDNEYNLLFGYGLNQTKQKLQVCYSETIKNESKKNWFLERRYNIHNQFLDFLIGYGFIGFLLFTFVLFYGFIKQRNNVGAISILITIVLFGMVESFLQRQIGVYLFALILTFNAYESRLIKLKDENKKD